MALVLGGLGSILLNEIGKVAMDNAPMIGNIAKDAVIEVAKNTFDTFLDYNPNFGNFLGQFGVRRFRPKRTFTNRGRGMGLAQTYP
jgi:hypothetical protein